MEGYVIRVIDKKGKPWYWTGAYKDAMWSGSFYQAKIYKEKCRAEGTRAKRYEEDFTGIWEKAQVIKVDIKEVKEEWVRASGVWFTPGGDPVWECPKCHGGEHVHGIEHPDKHTKCPDCGIELVYPGDNK